MSGDVKMTGHRIDQLVENALWLRNEYHMKDQHIAERLGVSKDHLQKCFARRGVKQDEDQDERE